MTAAPRVSCIVPAYNEAARIGAVLGVVAGHADIAEVIVVDDGSHDGTATAAEAIAAAHPNMRVLRQPRNAGKTKAVARGIAAARGDTLLLLDSDLVGLAPEDVSALIAPVAEGRADVSMSLRGNAPPLWRALGIDYISGERVLPRAVLAERLDELDALPRFGLEVFMNEIWLDRGYQIAVVAWPDVVSPMKSVKQGRWRGVWADVQMSRDVLRTVGLGKVVRQIFAMRARRV
jgi:glycosyltransferase involved in cell wall biosynthesis